MGKHPGTLPSDADDSRDGDPPMTKTAPHKFFTLARALVAGAALAAPAAHAETVVVTYELQNVWLQPDVFGGPQQMVGRFEWTYDEGDFENGSGLFTEIGIPWYGPDISRLDVNIDTLSTEFVLPGDFHDLGVDITLFFQSPLDPNETVPLDLTRSRFEIQNGGIHQGMMTSGSVVPVFTTCSTDITRDGIVDGGDLGLLISQWGQTESPVADLSADGVVDGSDLALMLSRWGLCP